VDAGVSECPEVDRLRFFSSAAQGLFGVLRWQLSFFRWHPRCVFAAQALPLCGATLATRRQNADATKKTNRSSQQKNIKKKPPKGGLPY
jgi:hypothetical protein